MASKSRDSGQDRLLKMLEESDAQTDRSADACRFRDRAVPAPACPAETTAYKRACSHVTDNRMPLHRRAGANQSDACPRTSTNGATTKNSASCYKTGQSASTSTDSGADSCSFNFG